MLKFGRAANVMDNQQPFQKEHSFAEW